MYFSFSSNKQIIIIIKSTNCISQSAQLRHVFSTVGLAVEMSSVWDLCSALWGDLQSVHGSSEGSDSSYLTQLARREAVSHWLTEASRDVITAEVETSAKKVSLSCRVSPLGEGVRGFGCPQCGITMV